jgi:hypothetical protein
MVLFALLMLMEKACVRTPSTKLHLIELLFSLYLPISSSTAVYEVDRLDPETLLVTYLYVNTSVGKQRERCYEEERRGYFLSHSRDLVLLNELVPCGSA